jgi:hypothetical protein
MRGARLVDSIQVYWLLPQKYCWPRWLKWTFANHSKIVFSAHLAVVQEALRCLSRLLDSRDMTLLVIQTWHAAIEEERSRPPPQQQQPAVVRRRVPTRREGMCRRCSNNAAPACALGMCAKCCLGASANAEACARHGHRR